MPVDCVVADPDVGRGRGGRSGLELRVGDLGYDAKLHQIGLGARHKNRRAVMLIADRDIRVVRAEDGDLLRH